MAVSNEMMGCALSGRPVLRSSRSLFLRGEQNSLCFSSDLLPRGRMKRTVHLRKSVAAPVFATISERIVRVAAEKPVAFKVRASVTVRKKNREGIKEIIANQFDAVSDKIGRNIVLELISAETDPGKKNLKRSGPSVLKNWSEKMKAKEQKAVFTTEFTVDSSFGVPGAVTVINRHQKEFFLESIVVEGFLCGPIHFTCHSWVQSTKDHPAKRVFFTEKPYLPSETPAGLKGLREAELQELRGDGKGERKLSDRIHDYATYNDLGNPDKGIEHARPVLGGKTMPYPRRCRTGRPPTDTDMLSESRVEPPKSFYVPRDEAFEEPKRDMLAAGEQKAILHNLIPSLVASFSPESHDFNGFHHIDSLYKEGLLLKQGLQEHLLKKIPFVNKIQEISEGLLRYDTPSILTKDKYAWLRDDEFARQAIAGINPVSIERLRVFPPVSNLDPAVYGPSESSIREEHIIGHLNGMSVQQALEENKLYILDFHDIYLPFLDRINAQDGRKAYATRTLFFLTPLGTLKPIAIELCLPPGTPSYRAKRVLSPAVDATTNWLWQLAKAHVCANDAGVHQLVNHFLRTHACTEPFILGAHRQLSAMHPIFKLLHPHMRYTLEINAMARQILINADGVIESCFTPGSVAMEMSSAAYHQYWRFDLEGLPADLIRRGMAEEDPTEPHGLRLLIKDYPYANDGLLIWSAIQSWVRTYVETYYPNPSLVRTDVELQAWYSECIRVGHADKRHANWWPTLSGPEDLVAILTTIIWLSSAQHAALNFGQYPLGGYLPNRPPLMRRLLPDEADPEYQCFLADPQRYFLSSLPSLMQAAQFMTVIDTLSTHSEDEEYLGERHRQTYTWTAQIAEAFNELAAEIRRIEEEIEKRNRDPALRNRCGAGVLPYELLMPSSEPGVTCRGVPNSVSI